MLIKLSQQKSSTQQINNLSKIQNASQKSNKHQNPSSTSHFYRNFLSPFSPCKLHEYDRIEVDIVITSTSQHIVVSLCMRCELPFPICSLLLWFLKNILHNLIKNEREKVIIIVIYWYSMSVVSMKKKITSHTFLWFQSWVTFTQGNYIIWKKIPINSKLLLNEW